MIEAVEAGKLLRRLMLGADALGTTVLVPIRLYSDWYVLVTLQSAY